MPANGWSRPDTRQAVRYDGASADELATLLGLPRVEVFDSVTSTQDVAHELAAAGAPAGTLVLGDEQRAGRGRQGRPWISESRAGVWLTLIERPSDVAAVDVLSLRVGLAIARALEPFADDAVRVKWPNDVYTSGGKLAGVLAEARWRDRTIEWVALGVGINVRAPAVEGGAAGLVRGTTRLDVLRETVPRLRAATNTIGHLTNSELAEFTARDFAVGRACVHPVAGRVVGIATGGELLIDTGTRIVSVRAGSLVLEEEAP